MSTPENKVKAFIDKCMSNWFPDAFRYAPPGVAYYGRNGMPDRTWLIKATDLVSIFVAIEAKAENGKLTDLQLVTLKRIAKQGGVAAVVVGNDLAHMERIRNEIIRRIQLANEGLKPIPIHPPSGDSKIPPL